MQLQNSLDELYKKIEKSKEDEQKILNIISDKDLIHKKYVLLSVFKKKFEDIIARFDIGREQEDELKEVNETIKLVADLHEHTNNFIKLNFATLNKQTNSVKQIGENLVYYGSKLAMFSGLYATGGLSLIPSAFAWYGSNKVSDSINDQLGFSEEETTTIVLLKAIQVELENTYTVLARILSSNRITPSVILNIQSTEINSFEQLSTRLMNTFFYHRDNASTGANQQGDLNKFSEATNDYIERTKQEKFLDEINHLNLTDEEKNLFEKFKDKITEDYANIPVFLNGNMFDLDTLLKISPNNQGKRKDPYSNYLFNLCHISDARTVANDMKEMIKLIKKQRETSHSIRIGN